LYVKTKRELRTLGDKVESAATTTFAKAEHAGEFYGRC